MSSGESVGPIDGEQPQKYPHKVIIKIITFNDSQNYLNNLSKSKKSEIVIKKEKDPKFRPNWEVKTYALYSRLKFYFLPLFSFLFF